MNAVEKLKAALKEAGDYGVFSPVRYTFSVVSPVSIREAGEHIDVLYQQYPDFAANFDGLADYFADKLNRILSLRESPDEFAEAKKPFLRDGVHAEVFRKAFLNWDKYIPLLMKDGKLMGQGEKGDAVHPVLLFNLLSHCDNNGFEKIDLWASQAQQILNTLDHPKDKEYCAVRLSMLADMFFEGELSRTLLETVTTPEFLPSNGKNPFAFVSPVADEKYIGIVADWVKKGGAVDVFNDNSIKYSYVSSILEKMGNSIDSTSYHAFLEFMMETYPDKTDRALAAITLNEISKYHGIVPPLFEELVSRGFDNDELLDIRTKLEIIRHQADPHVAMFVIMVNTPKLFALARKLEIPEARNIIRFYEKANSEFERMVLPENEKPQVAPSPRP